MKQFCLSLVAGVGLTALAGCEKAPPPPQPVKPYPTAAYSTDYSFKDDVTANAQFEDGELALSFKDLDGQEVAIESYREKKNVVLVMTRGFNGMYCPYCTSQTSRLMSNIDKFNALDAEIVVVFPGPSKVAAPFRDTILKQLSKEKLPFPLVVDEDFAVVDKLKLRGDLAAPSTFILDKQGKLRFAYVGKDNGDRPSLKAVIDQLELIQKG